MARPGLSRRAPPSFPFICRYRLFRWRLRAFYEAWPRGKPFQKFAPLQIQFGDPIYPPPEAEASEAAYEELTAELKSRVVECGRDCAERRKLHRRMRQRRKDCPFYCPRPPGPFVRRLSRRHLQSSSRSRPAESFAIFSTSCGVSSLCWRLRSVHPRVNFSARFRICTSINASRRTGAGHAQLLGSHQNRNRATQRPTHKLSPGGARRCFPYAYLSQVLPAIDWRLCRESRC